MAYIKPQDCVPQVRDFICHNAMIYYLIYRGKCHKLICIRLRAWAISLEDVVFQWQCFQMLGAV